MSSARKQFAVIVCLMLAISMLTGCGSEAKKEMQTAVSSANELIEKTGKPYDAATKKNLEKAIASADGAKDDDAYVKVTKKVKTTARAYQNSVKQLKQVTNPKEAFLIERAKTVGTITNVETATEENDPNKLLGKSDGYTSYIAMKSSLVTDDYYKDMSPVEAGVNGGAVIEAYKTKKDAKAREKYLASFDKSGALSSGSHMVIGTLVVRTSNELTATQQKELEKNIIDALIRLED